MPLSTDHTDVALPEASTPQVTTSRRLPLADALASLHLIIVSDCHTVASQTEPPRLAAGLDEDVPSPDPNTVTLGTPVSALLLRPITLILPSSIETDSEMLPDRAPAVIVTLRVPPDDPPTLHLTDVSDSHPVASQLVGPNLIPEVDEVLPSPTPCIVMLDDPVPAALILRMPLGMPASADTAPVMLPALLPTVTTIACVPPRPDAVLHLTDVTDIHSVSSHEVSPTLPFAV